MTEQTPTGETKSPKEDMWQLAKGSIGAAGLAVDAVLGAAETITTSISEAERRAIKAEFLATHDYLTGLLNVRGLEQELQKWVDKPGSPYTKVHIGVIDINGLKEINDGPGGHEAGDELIKSFTKILKSPEKSGLREGDIIARSSERGDEFILVLPGRDEIRDHADDSNGMPVSLEEKIAKLVEYRDLSKIFAMGMVETTRSELIQEGFAKFKSKADALMYGDKNRMKSTLAPRKK